MSLGISGSSAGAGGDLVRTGHYTGTGTAGVNGAVSITFDKKPAFVQIVGGKSLANVNVYFFSMAALSSTYSSSRMRYLTGNGTNTGSNTYTNYDDSTNTLSFYAKSDSYLSQAANESGYRYDWVAFFEE